MSVLTDWFETWAKRFTGATIWLDLVDVLILAVLIYQLLKMTRETRANQVLKGFAIVIVVAQISRWANLSGLSWLLGYIIDNFALVLVVLFGPELRQALERIGRGKILNPATVVYAQEDHSWVIDEIVEAVENMSATKTGALIVLQKRNPLRDILESGTVMWAKVSAPLLENIFVPNTPLHDGAVLIRDDLIMAAGCILPITSKQDLSQDMGTRHRAALGMSEASDALIVVVSEETGIISLAEGGRLLRYLDGAGLRSYLLEAFGAPQRHSLGDLLRRRKNS